MKRILLVLIGVFVVCIIGSALPRIAHGQAWTPVGPIPRTSHTAVFDESTNRMIVFGGGGSVSQNGITQNPNEVWRFQTTNSTWSSVAPSGTPPAPRIGHTAVFAPESNRMIVFGGGLGNTSPCANDVWVLTHAGGQGGTSQWLPITTAGSAPAPRLQHGAVYDPNSNTMIVIGGDDCFSTLFEDVSVLSNADGRGGTPTWTQLNPSGTGPGARELHNQVAYDPGSNTLIVFGGIGPGGTLFNDVWVLSNANGQGGTPTWSQLSPSGSLPPARSEGSVIYDAASGRLTVFGGEGPQLLNDVWVLTNANGSGGTPTWNQLGPFSPFPEARGDHSAVYVPSTNQMIVFGGLISDTLPTNNAWILSHANGM